MIIPMQTLEERAMGFDRAIPFSHLFAHCDCDVPGSVAVVTDATQLLAHQTIRAGVDAFFQLRVEGIEPVKHTLCHEPARLRRKSLETIKLIRGTLGLGPGYILHRIGRTMTVTRAAQDTARAALLEAFRIEPFFDSFKAERFFAFVFHRKLVRMKIL